MSKRSKDDPSPHYKRQTPKLGDGRFAEGEIIQNGRRICKNCQIWKDLSFFAKNKTGAAGLKANCRDCENTVARQRYANSGIGARRRQQKSEYDKARYEQLKAEGKNVSGDPEMARQRMLKRNYGLTTKDYDTMVAAQGNKCLICKVSGGKVRNQRLVVDHCHASGKVRGLLCQKCNLLLGHANDTVELLQQAISYLQSRGKEQML